MVRRALLRLPYYGVFDFLAFGVNRGIVTVGGFAYRATLKSDVSAAIKRVAGVDEIANKIEVLPASQNLGGHPKPAINRHLKTGN